MAICYGLSSHVGCCFGFVGLYVTCCRAAFLFSVNWIVALGPSLSDEEASVQLWGAVKADMFCIPTASDLVWVHPKSLCSKKGRDYFSDWFVTAINQVNSNSFVTQNRHYFYAVIQCVVFSPQIKIRAELLQSRNGYLHGTLQTTN